MAIPAVAYTRNIETLRRLVHESWRWLCARDPAEFAPDDRYAEIWAIVVTVRSGPLGDRRNSTLSGHRDFSKADLKDP